MSSANEERHGRALRKPTNDDTTARDVVLRLFVLDQLLHEQARLVDAGQVVFLWSYKERVCTETKRPEEMQTQEQRDEIERWLTERGKRGRFQQETMARDTGRERERERELARRARLKRQTQASIVRHTNTREL